jgi:CRP/FNR family transcriptional regulator, cyclic AMP receptor protein
MRLADHILPEEVSLPPVSILAGMREAGLKLLAREAQRHEFSAGSLIVREGDPGNRLFLIESGKIRVYRKSGDQRERELGILSAGDAFGEGCILTTLPRLASVQALTDAVVFSLSSMTFYHLYKAMPDQYSILLLNIARELSRRLRKLDEAFAGCH